MWIRTQKGILVNLDTGCQIFAHWNGKQTDVWFPGDESAVCLHEGNVMERVYEIIPIAFDFMKEADS